jgi:DNA-directed RNA polymerase specialized sigma24 family protein
MQQALARLPERLLLVLDLRTQGFSNTEIAFVLGVSAQVIGAELKEIQRRLRDALARPLDGTQNDASTPLPSPRKSIETGS